MYASVLSETRQNKYGVQCTRQSRFSGRCAFSTWSNWPGISWVQLWPHHGHEIVSVKKESVAVLLRRKEYPTIITSWTIGPTVGRTFATPVWRSRSSFPTVRPCRW
jgi:hypothetical protein